MRKAELQRIIEKANHNHRLQLWSYWVKNGFLIRLRDSITGQVPRKTYLLVSNSNKRSIVKEETEALRGLIAVRDQAEKMMNLNYELPGIDKDIEQQAGIPGLDTPLDGFNLPDLSDQDTPLDFPKPEKKDPLTDSIETWKNFTFEDWENLDDLDLDWENLDDLDLDWENLDELKLDW